MISGEGLHPVLVVPPPPELASSDVVDRTTAVGHCCRRVSRQEVSRFSSFHAPSISLALVTLFHATGGTQLLRSAVDGALGHPRRSCSSSHGGSLSTVAGTGLVALWSFYVTRWPAPLVNSNRRPPPSAVVCGLLPVLVCVGWGSRLSGGRNTVILGLVCGVAGLSRAFWCRILRVALLWAVE
ncbi:uncharacterized protein G2W53_039851 [Senna tora]|uniref:Uncharacterized protein n=1 Tax=Senna tora TaxID=362788 RepID=A0A834SRQ5_9FABA|nr:uncharacterized protein G2W53_039851 [Senna tora]